MTIASYNCLRERFVMDILEAIAEKEKQIEQLRREINTLHSAARILDMAERRTEKAKSQPAMAASILDEIGKPMHVSQIVDQIKKRFRISVKTNTLGVTLYRYAKRNSSFYKVKGKPNTYGLVKWQAPSERAESIRGTQEKPSKVAS